MDDGQGAGVEKAGSKATTHKRTFSGIKAHCVPCPEIAERRAFQPGRDALVLARAKVSFDGRSLRQFPINHFSLKAVFVRTGAATGEETLQSHWHRR